MPQAMANILHNPTDVMQIMFSGLRRNYVREWDEICKRIAHFVLSIYKTQGELIIWKLKCIYGSLVSDEIM